ncbi:hypothetical protein FHS29_006205 [Saccharothrix tamanrassetensis]|uniref:Uncharacterized protein n=1 Tax=Saccharothrix tamanrassetensis TaxID=1051531 RepID=A0A841CTE2_9PSEU|nr:hypothetical protein [Saccharothrix tamanrassetensis]MBB5959584.1 hypothetical protein [Saccharothrix tamanrassetensis]
MPNNETRRETTTDVHCAFTFLYGVLLLVSTLVVVVTQVRFVGVATAALDDVLAGALLAGWEKCRAGREAFGRAVTATTRR